jgi:putative ABC transport system ATP-binding protein
MFLENTLPILETITLSKQYQLGNHIVDALDAINFSVEEGEFVAIMGPSGSGKSTLLHLLGGLDNPSEGEVVLRSQNLSSLKDKQITLIRRRNIGFVFQFFNLIPTLSAKDNITLPLLIDGKNPRKYSDRMENILSLVGLEDRSNHKPDQLSGGEQQRVAIARAMITEPEILLADEPTGNLDSHTGNSIMRLLRRTCDEFGQTIIIVTHDPRAAAFADRVVILGDGKIEAQHRFENDPDISNKVQSIIELMESLETIDA